MSSCTTGSPTWHSIVRLTCNHVIDGYCRPLYKLLGCMARISLVNHKGWRAGRMKQESAHNHLRHVLAQPVAQNHMRVGPLSNQVFTCMLASRTMKTPILTHGDIKYLSKRIRNLSIRKDFLIRTLSSLSEPSYCNRTHTSLSVALFVCAPFLN